MDDAALAKVESQRSELEANIAKLKKDLHHWQTLELDYEGLREEFHLLPEDSSSEQCSQVVQDFGPTLINETDLQALLKDAKASPRTPKQLTHLLLKRVEYVARNIETLRKQILNADKKRNALLLAEDPDHRDEAGLPLSEITEELDESGNVVSSKVERPGGEATKLVDVLEKAGVDGIKDTKIDDGEVDSLMPEEGDEQPGNDDEDSADEIVPPSAAAKSTPKSEDPQTDRQLPPFNPFDTADEARLREEMLKYRGLHEIGDIVAELDLAEGSSDVSHNQDDEDLLLGSDLDEDLDEDDDDESEDETGKAKHPTISIAYKRKMEELEKNLGLKDMKNLGPDPNLPPIVQNDLERPSAAEAARKAALARQEETTKSALKPANKAEPGKATQKPKKKAVAFSENLDIAHEEPPKKKPIPSRTKSESTVNPLSESVIERSTHDEARSPQAPALPSSSTSAPKKVSRFKKDKQQAYQQMPSSEHSKTQSQPLVAPTVLERPSTSDPSANQPPDPSSIDDEMHRRDIAMDYHKLRNRRIHSQGGFVTHYDDDGEEDDFDDAMQDYGIVDPETGNVRKVSRFKAARVRG